MSQKILAMIASYLATKVCVFFSSLPDDKCFCNHHFLSSSRADVSCDLVSY